MSLRFNRHDLAGRGFAFGLAFMAADACRLPFHEKSFDMVIAVFSIVHTMTRPRARDCLAEIARILKPNGTLIFTTPNRELSQDLYQENPNDDPRLFFCHLLRHEYNREELRSFLLPFVGEKGHCFSTFSIDSLTNTTFRPVLKEVLSTMKRRRFRDSQGEAPFTSLVKRLVPQSIKARYFFRMVRKACRRRKVSLLDIALGARHHRENDVVETDHFLVIARKAG